MKNNLYLTLTLIFSAVVLYTVQADIVSLREPQATVNHDWERVQDNSWPGPGGMRYQYDRANGRLILISYDSIGYHSSSVENAPVDRPTTSSYAPPFPEANQGIWVDKSGKWYRIAGKKLEWSNDNGKIWRSVSGCSKWEGYDGNWYKFDKDRNLWVNRQ